MGTYILVSKRNHATVPLGKQQVGHQAFVALWHYLRVKGAVDETAPGKSPKGKIGADPH
jgi:hypothetical protein